MNRSQGFSLIELMIVVAIIGVLASIAIPNYNEYIQRSRITRAVAALSDMRVKLEQYFQDNRTYVDACAAGTVAPLPPAGDNPDFTISCPTLTATAFVVQADGDGATASGKMSGFLYNVNQANAKSTTLSNAAGKASRGWSGSGNACWVISKGGGC